MRIIRVLSCVLAVAALSTASAAAAPFYFSTGNPDGKMATAAQPSSLVLDIESADDFILDVPVTISHATFTGLLPVGANVTHVRVEIYRVFPKDSDASRTPNVPTRANSPADVAFGDADSTGATLSFTTSILNPSFTAANSVLNGINPFPNQTTGGEGSVTGQEVQFSVSFNPPLTLPPDHYFFVPQVALSTGTFFWLSAPKPIVAPGTPFTPDLQSWIRNENLAPDWLRVGTDVVGGTTPPTFNAAFSLDGEFTITAAPALDHIGFAVLTVMLVGAGVTLLSRAAASRRE